MCVVTLSRSFGAVVYTGNETKFGQNKNTPKQKIPISDSMTSVFTVVIVCLQVSRSAPCFSQILLIFVLTPIGLSLNRSHPRWYLESTIPNLPLVLALRFLLLNVAMVPSSLKVTLELIKVLYTAFIHRDPHFNDPRGTRSTVHCNSMALNEALGCVRFILTDKTGTLTQNRLVLKELCAADDAFFSFFSF